MTAIVNFPKPDTPEMRMARAVLRDMDHHHIDTIDAACVVLDRSAASEDRLLVASAAPRFNRAMRALDAALYGPPAPRSWATIDSLLAWVCAGAVAGGVGVLIGRALAAWWVAN